MQQLQWWQLLPVDPEDPDAEPTLNFDPISDDDRPAAVRFAAALISPTHAEPT